MATSVAFGSSAWMQRILQRFGQRASGFIFPTSIQLCTSSKKMDGYGTTVPVRIAAFRKQSSKANIDQREKCLRLIGEPSITGLLNDIVSTRNFLSAFIVPTFTMDLGSCRLRRLK